ncbi:MAG: phosphatase domain-containing protein [bacterium]
MSPPYPILYVNERTLPPDYDGPVYVWDVDKTYLDTDFKSLWGLLRIPLEMAIDKTSIPGTAAALQECRRGPGDHPQHTPIFFVSASPPQLAGVIRRKMLLDGLQPDGFLFKDQLRLALQGRFRQLKFQVEYKLSAHWSLIAELPPRARLIVVGDDWESDGQVFALLDAAQRGELTGSALRGALLDAGVGRRFAEPMTELAARAAGRAQVQLACVILTRGREPEYFDPFSPPVRAAREALQAAAIFAEAGLISPDGVARVAWRLQADWGWNTERVHFSLDDLAVRGLVSSALLDQFRAALD